MNFGFSQCTKVHRWFRNFNAPHKSKTRETRREKTPRSCLLFHNWALEQTPLRPNVDYCVFGSCLCVLDVDENHLIFEHSHINKPMFLKITKSIYTSIWITSSNCYCSGLYLYITWCVECVPNLFVNNSHFCRFHCDISMLLLSFASLFLLIEYAWLRELILLAIFLALFLVLEFNLTRSRFFSFLLSATVCVCVFLFRMVANLMLNYYDVYVYYV